MATSKNLELAQLASTLVVDDTGTVTNLNIDTTNIDNIVDVNLAIAPEILEIQVSAPAAGQDTAWLWTWLTSSLPYARRTITNSPEVSVPLYKQGTYTLNNYAAYELFGDMTQTHTLYFKWIDGAGTDNLVSWANSTGPVSDSHPDINGGNPTDVQRISISVPATVIPPTLTAPSVSYTVTNSGSGAYTFSGSAKGDNPNIGPFYRGGTYTININASGHPFYFTTDNGTNFAAGTYFGEYTTGVTGSRTDVGTITFTVPVDAPNTLYYQCGNHGPMRGAITVKDLAVETNINGNYIIYAQHTQEGHKTPIEIRPIPSLVNQMCLVYDASIGKFVPQDLATYVENTPSFENKIREVAGTAELVVEDGSAVIAKVNVYDDSTYLPLVGNNPGDQAFATDTDILYIWDGSAWQQAGAANTDDLAEGITNLFFTNERVDDRVANLVVGGNNITATYDDVAGTLTLDGQPGYTDTDVATYLSTNGYDTATNIIASITDSAPATLDTLNELAAALGDDPNFATTITNSIATKANAADVYTQTQIDTALALKAPINNPTFTGVISGDGSGITNLVFPATTNRYSFVATANQTTFTATYTTGNVDVFLNGIKLVRTSEYDDTSGTSIILTSGADVGEIVEIIAYENFTVGDAVSASAGGTFGGPVTVSGVATVGSTLTLRQDGTNDEIKSLGNVLYVKAPEYSFQNTSGTEYMSIDTSGNVGIGTSNPAHTLEINGTTAVPLKLKTTSTAGTGLYLANDRAGSKTFGILSGNVGAGYFNIKDETSAENRFVIDPSGNIGIGTTTPTAKLDVANNNIAGVSSINGGQLGGRRNLIINGGFDVWQRGTTVNTTDYSADRWMQWMTNSGVSNRNVNCTKQTGGPIGRNSSYIRFAPQVVDTGMEKFSWGQKIEKVNLDHIESGQSLTLSFWIKKEQNLPTDNNMAVQILYPNSVDGWSSGYLFRNDENIDQTLANISFNSLSTSWTRYSYTFVPSDTALDRGLAVYWHVGDTDFNLNNTNPLISFTGVQLEVGTTATPFEHRSYNEELAACQRYYETGVIFGQYKSSDDTGGWAHYKVTKRINPSIQIFPPDFSQANYAYYYSTAAADRGNRNVNEINPTAWFAGQTDYTAGLYAIMGGFTPSSINDATWVGNYRVDAEL